MVKHHQVFQSTKTQIKPEGLVRITSLAMVALVKVLMVILVASDPTKNSSEKISKDNKEKREKKIKTIELRTSIFLIFSINKQIFSILKSIILK